MERDFESRQDQRLLAIPLEGDAAAGREAALPVRRHPAHPTGAVVGERPADRLSLSGEWRMRGSHPTRLTPILASDGWPWRDLPSTGVAEGWHRPETDRTAWHRVTVPTTVQRALVDLGELPDPMWDANTYRELVRYGRPRRAAWHLRKTRVEQQEWWFVRTFSAPARWRGHRVRLRFDGVDYACSVYLNGEPLGYHEGLYGGPTHNIGGILEFDASNTLAVRIHPPTEDWRPALKGSPGWGWHYGHLISAGIWRDVFLEAVPQVAVRDLQVTTLELQGDAAKVQVDFTVDVDGADDVAVTCGGTITAVDGSAPVATFVVDTVAPPGQVAMPRRSASSRSCRGGRPAWVPRRATGWPCPSRPELSQPPSTRLRRPSGSGRSR